MRILEVTPGYFPTIGGVERHVQAISEQLAALGHEVTVATMDPLGERRDDGLLNGVFVRHFPSVGPTDEYRLPRGLAAWLRGTREHWDVVHVHNYHAPLIPLVTAVRPRALVVTPHLNDVPHSRAAALLHTPYRLLGRWAMRRSDAVVCVSSAEQERVVARLGVPLSRTVVIPNGVDEGLLERPTGRAARESGLLLAVGRLQPYKRVEDAISALALLDDRFRLAVVGEGPYREQLQSLASALDVSGRVAFVGRATDGDLADWFARAETVLNFSSAEAFGMTVLEAVAWGCRVVCSDIPAFRDLADRFPEHISVVREHSDAARAAAIRTASEQGLIAPADVTAFTWRSIAERLSRLFGEVAGAPGAVQTTSGSKGAGSVVVHYEKQRSGEKRTVVTGDGSKTG